MLRILLLAVLLMLSALVFSPSQAHAAVCTVQVADLDFGAVDAIGNTPATTTAGIDISCDGITSGTTTITVCGNLGAGSAGEASGVRQAVSGGNALGFALYASSGTSQPWGSTANPELGNPLEIDLPVSGTTASTTVELYGIVPSGQSSAPVGDYQTSFGSSDAVFTYAEGALDCAAPSGGTDAYAAFAVNASIAANCLLETNDLDFGTAGIIGEDIDADTSIAITCTPGTGYGITIDGGGSGDPDHRQMHSGTDTVDYDLYSDAARHNPWGTSLASTVTGSGSGDAQQMAVYGRIPPQQAAPGHYTDTVVVTITY